MKRLLVKSLMLGLLFVLMFKYDGFGWIKSMLLTGRVSVAEAADPIQAAFKKLKAQRSFSSYGFITMDGREASFEYDYVGPDSYRYVHSRGGENAGTLWKMIVIGKDEYFKPENGSWKKLSADDEGRPAGNGIDDVIDKYIIKNQKKIEYGSSGRARLNGLPMKVHEGVYREENGETKIKCWIGERDKLPHQIDIEIKSGSGNELRTLNYTLLVYDFGAEIEIEAPM